MGERTYCRGGWNTLDLFVTIVSIVSIAIPKVRLLRALRALRPLILLAKLKQTRVRVYDVCYRCVCLYANWMVAFNANWLICICKHSVLVCVWLCVLVCVYDCVRYMPSHEHLYVGACVFLVVDSVLSPGPLPKTFPYLYLQVVVNSFASAIFPCLSVVSLYTHKHTRNHFYTNVVHTHVHKHTTTHAHKNTSTQSHLTQAYRHTHTSTASHTISHKLTHEPAQARNMRFFKFIL